LGSNDGKNWIQLDSQSNQSWSGRFVTNVYEISNTVAYKYFKFDVITPSSGGKIVAIAEIKLIGEAGD
jgi:hypothetical protein